MELPQLAAAVIVFLGVLTVGFVQRYRMPETDTPPSPPIKDVRSTDEFDGPTVDVTITSSNQLLASNGRAPEQTVARYLAAAFEDAEHNYRIRCDFSAVNPPAEGTVGSGTPDWWRTKSLSETRSSAHVDMLLVDQQGGGGTYGGRCVVGAGGIDENLPVREYGEGAAFGCIHAALHEVAHVLQIPHDLDDEQQGKQHTGEGWNENDKWHYTPMNVDNGVENNCGKHIPKREYDERVHHVRWTDCTAEKFQITESKQGQLA